MHRGYVFTPIQLVAEEPKRGASFDKTTKSAFVLYITTPPSSLARRSYQLPGQALQRLFASLHGAVFLDDIFAIRR